MRLLTIRQEGAQNNEGSSKPQKINEPWAWLRKKGMLEETRKMKSRDTYKGYTSLYIRELGPIKVSRRSKMSRDLAIMATPAPTGGYTPHNST